MTGAGGVTDTFRTNAVRQLETLAVAHRAGAVTAAVGQGLGPMHDEALRKKAAAVYPLLDFIFLREGIASPRLLDAFGVDPARVVVTGDDAIALAYAARRDTTGDALGVNLRTAPYANVDAELMASVGRVLDATGAPLVAIPIAAHEDLAAAHSLGAGGEEPESLDALLQLIGRCRVVVTGSYHAAVFALAMGIPAVTIAAAEYYVDKFRGLAGQFGPACRVVIATQPEFASHLRRAIDAAWQEADATRAPLLHAAARQIAAGEAAYARLVSACR